MNPVLEMMGWTRCGRCKNHLNSSDWFNTEYPLDYQPTALDIIYYLQREYQHVYVRRWDSPKTVWAAWVAETDQTIAEQDPTALEVIAQFSADTEMAALEGLLRQLSKK